MAKTIELLSIPERWEITVNEEVEAGKVKIFRETEPGTSNLYYAIKIQARSLKHAETLISDAQRVLRQERAVRFVMGPPDEPIGPIHFISSEIRPLSYSMACEMARFMRVYEQLDFVYKMAVAAVIFSLAYDHDAQKAIKIGDGILRESGYKPIFSEDKPTGRR